MKKETLEDRLEAVLDDNVNHPAHYTYGSIEVIDVIEGLGLPYHLGNAVKYIARAGHKDPEKTTEDLQKAVWYLNRYNVLLTDRVFLSLSVPLQPEQERELEESLLLDGCREPIITWNGVIIDGHKRYHFCSAEGIEYSTEEMDFLSAEEAISWVCRKHIPKYGKKSVPYRYLVGRFYKAQKEIYREIRKQPESVRRIQLNPEWDRVSYYIAEELNLHHATIESHGAYAAAMEQIADKAWNLFEAILSETITASKNNILEYAGMDIKQLDELCRDRWNMSHDERSAIRIRTRRKRREPAEPIKEIPLSVGIKEMPTYDPDMEVNGLSLTIPTWIIAINRAKKKTDQATENGKAQLARSLIRLRDEIDELLEDIGHG